MKDESKRFRHKGTPEATTVKEVAVGCNRENAEGEPTTPSGDVKFEKRRGALGRQKG